MTVVPVAVPSPPPLVDAANNNNDNGSDNDASCSQATYKLTATIQSHTLQVLRCFAFCSQPVPRIVNRKSLDDLIIKEIIQFVHT